MTPTPSPSAKDTLDASLALHPGERPHTWQAVADPAREANTGMFGGWTAALLLKAVQADAALAGEDGGGSPSALSLNFMKRVPPGAALTLRTQCLGPAARWPPGRRSCSPPGTTARR